MDRDEDFIVRTMSADEVAMSVEWAAAEGWNPGLHDPPCFREADPAGFFVGVWRNEPVACLAAVAYDERFGFIGLYIVKPEFRGRGFGMRIWQHGMRYLGDRNIGLDGVVAQQANYRKSGFRLAYRNIRYQGLVRYRMRAGDYGGRCAVRAIARVRSPVLPRRARTFHLGVDCTAGCRCARNRWCRPHRGIRRHTTLQGRLQDRPVVRR